MTEINWNQAMRDMAAIFGVSVRGQVGVRVDAQTETLYLSLRLEGDCFEVKASAANCFAALVTSRRTRSSSASGHQLFANPRDKFFVCAYLRGIGYDCAALETEFAARFSAHDRMDWALAFRERLRECGIDETPFVAGESS